MDQVRKHPTGFHPRVVIEVARRSVSLLLLVVAAVIGFGYGSWWWAALAAAMAVAVYVLPPRPIAPAGALHHERMPSVYMPDLVGFLLATTFLAMPFVISAQETWLGGPWFLILFMWPPGLIALAIFRITTRYQCFWVKLTPDGLTVSTTVGIESLPFDRIAGARVETKRPPRWLGPLLVLFGGFRGVGIALLHADTERHALLVHRSDGTTLHLPADAFPGIVKVIKALAKAGVSLDAQLQEAAGHSAGPGKRKKKRIGHDEAGQPRPS